MRRALRCVAAALPLLVQTGQTPQDADALAGLWKAQRWFGPYARGLLVIRRSGTTYTADMIGQTLAVRVTSGDLSFELPNG